jgi:hypothetical protein
MMSIKSTFNLEYVCNKSHLLIMTAMCIGAINAANAATTLYTNDFESPDGFVDTTGRDVSQQTVSSLYDLAGFSFQQTSTVETLEINGDFAFSGGYSDPSGTGGNYAIGMLSSVQDDKLSLTFDVGSFDFLNIFMDISAIDLDGVGGPFGVDQPIFRASLYDSPGGAFNINAPGTLLDQVDLTGTGTPSQSIFDWTRVVAALSTEGNTDGNVTFMLDLTQSGYASFDNIKVDADEISGVVPIPAAVWLFGSGLIGLIGVARRKKV